MKTISKEIFKKIFSVSQDVKNTLEKKGIAIPVQNDDGSINFGDYTVKKNDSGLYNILDYGNRSVVENINLPQTAILLANGLALGKFLDDAIVSLDRKYGYALFEESRYQDIISKKSSSGDKIDLCLAKTSVLKLKKDEFRKQILSKFEKLRQNV